MWAHLQRPHALQLVQPPICSAHMLCNTLCNTHMVAGYSGGIL